MASFSFAFVPPASPSRSYANLFLKPPQIDMASDAGSDDFELVDSLDVAKQIVAEKKPDLSKINLWLKPTDYTALSSEYHRHLSSRAPETGEWIRETSQFRQWHSSDHHGSIWIKAVPGAGKSVLAASMVDSLARNESVPVLYFFFREIVESNRSARALLRDWFSQLLPFSETLQMLLWERVEEKKGLEDVSTTQLWKYLLDSLRSVDRAYCVVDALDEMAIDEDFLSRLNLLGAFRPAHVKVLMTSRPKQYLQRLLKDPQVIYVSLQEELVKRDISVFVHQRTVDFGRDGAVGSRTLDFVQENVCARSQGLFLYARLMLDQIAKVIRDRGKGGEDSIREMVAKLPVGLEEMYNRVLSDYAALNKIDQNTQLLILQLVTHSARPMRLIELGKALETRPDVAASDRDSKEIVRSACGPLLEIMEDEVVQILHHSFTEFLLDGRRMDRSTPEMPQFPIIKPSSAHRDIGLACLAYLQGPVFETYPKEDDPEKGEAAEESMFVARNQKPFNFRATSLQYPLMEYAAKKWPYHAKRAIAEDGSIFTNIEEFCEPRSPPFRAWLEFMSKDADSAVSIRSSSFLHIAAGFGLVSWASRLIQRGLDVDALDSSENTPLFWASKSGCSEVVDLLLKAGAKPDVDGWNGLKPLHVAASRNHAQVVRLLLAVGVSPTTSKPREVGQFCGNAPTSIGEHPLMYASREGHVETVLEMIPYTDIRDLEDALCWAAGRGHSQLVSTLFQNSKVSADSIAQIRVVSVNDTDGGETALMLAAGSLEPECVRILLDNGASAQKKTPIVPNYGFANYSVAPGGRTPLHSLAEAAVIPARETAARKIMEMLLSAGADLEAADTSGNTPIMLAIATRRFPAHYMLINLEIFLSAGADPCTMDSKGETLLHRACRNMTDTTIASKLLNYKAVPGQARSSDGATPLHCAVQNIRCPSEHIQLLVDHGADINAKDFEGNTPLHAICRAWMSPKDLVLSTLLRLEADVNLQNVLGQTCLHVFLKKSNLVTEGAGQVQLILEAGADLEIRDHNGMTVLLNAIVNDQDFLEVLLQHSTPSSISARSFLGGKTALHLACQKMNPLDLVKMLINNGADVQWTDNDGNTLLHEVARRFGGYPSEIELVEELVKWGVPIDARNSRQQTALHIVPLNKEIFVRNHQSDATPTRQSLASLFLRLNPHLDLNVQDIDGYTPLHFASAASEALAFNLICRGANINAKSWNLRTPLHCAARGRQSGIVAMLLHFGTQQDSIFEVNAADEHGRTALHDACRSGRPESVTLLIGAGADIEHKDKYQITPLLACAEFIEEDRIWSCMRDARINQTRVFTSHTIQDPFRPMPRTTDQRQRVLTDSIHQRDTVRIGVIAKMLIKAGASIDGALRVAVERKNAELLVTIRREVPEELLINGRNNKDNTIYFESLLILPALSVDAVLDNCRGSGPLDNPIACIEDMDEVTMDALLARGVDFTKAHASNYFAHSRGMCPSDDDTTAIGKIARLGMIELMSRIIMATKLLDDPLFSVNQAQRLQNINPRMRPLLQVACGRPLWNMDMIKLLITQGKVDVNAQEQKSTRYGPGSTALHVLAKGDFWWQVDAIEYLVKDGAEIDAFAQVDQDGKLGTTPLHIACTYNKFSDGDDGFFRPQCCEMLLQLGADPNQIDPQGLTPLNHAGPDSDIIKVLLKYGADVNAGTKGVLISAIEAKDVKTLKLYLENGANCNVQNTSTEGSRTNSIHRGWYPIGVAAHNTTGARKDVTLAREMVQLLLDHGARTDVTVSDDNLLLHFLFEHCSSSILRPFVAKPDLNFNLRDQKERTVFAAACHSSVMSETPNHATSHKEQTRLEAEYIPSYMLIADSKLHGSSIDYLAVDKEGKHLIFNLMSEWNDKIAARFLPIPGVRALICQKDNDGFTPLHLALQKRNVKLCSDLMEQGDADLVEPDPEGNTALHLLCRNTYMVGFEPYLTLMQKFLSLGGDINARNNLGETALLVFLVSGAQRSFGSEDHIDGFPFFIKNGADFRAAKRNGATTLHVIARRESRSKARKISSGEEEDYNAGIFRRLVELGCDPLQEDKKGRTALDVAAVMENEGILALYERKKGA